MALLVERGDGVRGAARFAGRRGVWLELGARRVWCSLVLPTPRMAVLQTTLSNGAFIFFWLIRPPAKARKACLSASRGGLLEVRSGLDPDSSVRVWSPVSVQFSAAYSCIRPHLVERTSLELPCHPLLETRSFE